MDKGERLASVEAKVHCLESERADAQDQLDRRLHQTAELFEEKLDGLRREVVAKAEAQKDAVDKAEKSASAQFATFVEQNDRKAEVTQGRLAALERGESSDSGAKRGASELKTSTVAWIAAASAALYTILYLIHP